MKNNHTEQFFSASTKLSLSPFFARTSKLNQSQEWRRWGGYLSATKYDLQHENEYFAIRTKAALLDISPLYKYSISGNNATFFLNNVVTRNILTCKVGQVMYTPWCDEHGKVIDDGTIQRLSKNEYLLTSAEPNLDWLLDNAMGMDVTIEDNSENIAALALQGPNSRAILNSISSQTLNQLKFFYLLKTDIKSIPVTISRTGYTGDLGYEIWTKPHHALDLWDILMENGKSFGITPTGLHALDIARIEAAFILLDVDYISARHTTIDNRKSSPFELGLDWTIKIQSENFMGKNALIKEKNQNSTSKLRGIEIKWDPLEKEFKKLGLPPELPLTAWRHSTPIYRQKKQIGYATSGCWSPILKRYIALAHIQSEYAAIGTNLHFEIKIEHVRKLTPAIVVETPFFNPERKRSCPK